MSHRRSISFSKNESDLLKYFDNNGKSDVIKVALKFYIDNKDKLKPESILNELSKLLRNNKIIGNSVDYESTPIIKKNKGIKLIK